MNDRLKALYDATQQAYQNYAAHGGRQYDAAYSAAFSAQMREIKHQGKEAEAEYNAWIAERIGQLISP